MRSEFSILHTLACGLFSLGLILVTSGWAPAISRMMSHRPAWSVCGQALCDCRPLEMPEDCPLCIVGLTGRSGCTGDEPPIDPARVALRHTGDTLPVLHLGLAAEGLMAGLFLLGLGSVEPPRAADAGSTIRVVSSALPALTDLDIPTPPPRA